ncbi:MAG: recombinase family protein [Candidatus Thorarchaeota archaeon]|jgi:hypothetical protein
MDIIQRIAQLESEQIGERVYMGMKQKASTVGGPMGGYAPFGYAQKEGRLVVKESEAEVVRQVFEECLKGHSTQNISCLLNSKRVATKNGKPWIKQSVAWILKNPAYCGFMEWDDVVKRGDHEAIIDVRTFNEVQKELVKRIRVSYQKYEPRLLPDDFPSACEEHLADIGTEP